MLSGVCRDNILYILRGVKEERGRFRMEWEKQTAKSVVDQVVDGIISEIIEGRLAPGGKLPT